MNPYWAGSSGKDHIVTDYRSTALWDPRMNTLCGRWIGSGSRKPNGDPCGTCIRTAQALARPPRDAGSPE